MKPLYLICVCYHTSGHLKGKVTFFWNVQQLSYAVNCQVLVVTLPLMLLAVVKMARLMILSIVIRSRQFLQRVTLKSSSIASEALEE